MPKKPKYNYGDTPHILIDIGKDEPTRGDIHGLIGIAENLADMTKGTITRSTNKYNTSPLAERLPDFILQSPNIRKHREWYEHRNRYPTEQKVGVLLNEINEDTCDILRIERVCRDLVPHHLTKKRLKSEGQKFQHAYPNLPRPLIGVNLVHVSSRLAKEFSRKISATLEKFDKATLFICPMRRTYKTDIYNLRNALSLEFKNASLYSPLRLASIFNKEASKLEVVVSPYHADETKYNPYIGLLDQADHVCMLGYSASILSESLFTGKTLHMIELDNHDYPALQQSGFVKDMLKSKTLKTQRTLPSINTAYEVACKLERQYRKQREAQNFYLEPAKGFI